MSAESSENTGRKRRMPDYFGKIANVTDLLSDEEEPFLDDSMDDKNYSPQENTKVVTTVKRIRLDKTKTVQSTNLIRSASVNVDHLFSKIDETAQDARKKVEKSAQIGFENRNTYANGDNSTTNQDNGTESFEQALGKTDNSYTGARSNEFEAEYLVPNSQETGNNQLNQSVAISFDKTDDFQTRITSNDTNTAAGSSAMSMLPEDGSHQLNDFAVALEKFSRSFMQLEKTNQEILCRLKVIEKYWLEDGHQNDRDSQRECERNEQLSFLQSIGLPFKHQQNLQKLEDDLNDEKFRKTLHKALSKIPDKQSAFQSGCVDKALKRFLFEIIDRPTLSNYSWSGKTKKSRGIEKKIAFKSFSNIRNLLIMLVESKGIKCSIETYEYQMVNKILKYAYSYDTPKGASKPNAVSLVETAQDVCNETTISCVNSANCQTKTNTDDLLAAPAKIVADAKVDDSCASRRNIPYPPNVHPVMNSNAMFNFRQNNQNFGTPFNYAGNMPNGSSRGWMMYQLAQSQNMPYV